jgi:diguanylate cyclase (GGDEF)-like protein
MKLVYLACGLLWLAISALIGLSFAGRSVLSAEQHFSAFNQQLFEQLAQKLQTNQVLLDSFSAYCAQSDTAAGQQRFARRLLHGHPQILDLSLLDKPISHPSRHVLLHKNDAQSYDWGAILRKHPLNARQRQALRAGAPVSWGFRLNNGEPAYLMLQAVGDTQQKLAAMVVRADALLQDMAPLPEGASLNLSPAWGDALHPAWSLQRNHGARSALERLLLPRLEARRQVGDAAQLLMVSVSWQLGARQLDPFACMVAGLLVLALLTIMMCAVGGYQRFLSGNQERETHLFYMANHDRLTSLANRNLFYDRLHHAILRLNRNGRRLAVLFLDMDRFKPVNDTYGHAAGDMVLQTVAARMKIELRGEDTLARLGGDEFLALLEDIESKEEVDRVVGRLKHAIEMPYEFEGHFIELGVSIGVAYYPEDGVLIEELLTVADRKMYGDKSEPVLANGV